MTPKYDIDLDGYSDAQILTFHRQYVLSNGEAIEEFRRRSWPDTRIELALKANVAIRNEELADLDWLQ